MSNNFKKNTMILLIIIIALLIVGLTRPPKVIGYTVYVVEEKNDSLWKIAEKNSPESVDKRKYISEMYNLNYGLTTEVFVGQKIKIPVYEEK